uniref:HHLA2 member of B7 family n=1 Tax=Sphenodon punctatus TaxID=8508 RepID=A0A8D0HSI8_SPHPU
MKTQKTLPFLILLFELFTLSGLTEVTGRFAEDCVLPCSFPPGEDEAIHWKHGTTNVHSYYFKQDQLSQQNPGYQSRTALFHEEIPKGNASLKLHSLRLNDSGSYHCYVGTKSDKTDKYVTLKIAVLPYYTMEYENKDTIRLLKCYAFHIYPEPKYYLNITWGDDNKPIQTTKMSISQDGPFFSVRSDQNITNPNSSYQCNIQNSYLNQTWTAEWKTEGSLSSEEGTMISIPCTSAEVCNDTKELIITWKKVDSASVGLEEINQRNYSLTLRDLTQSDNGEYLCNISTPHCTQITVRYLHVEKRNKDIDIWIIALTLLLLVVIILISILSFLRKEREPLPSG